ncbi:hypothetical protein B7R22_02470 [Subtercola boreus]|uniref:HTH gntR-type domain-containing protein n=1 Tax=Subtercola boreus TaxID=120213 RepID=A0A3E0W4R4_9MICO|nr:YhfZ family protein [Subtercola boreus]RFA16739.1 hypothetical protein B7R22_02470 [Subtercola boreus]
MGKTADAVQELARATLGIPVGGQVPTTTELARNARTGSGTIQAALKQLESSGAMKISSHGSFGRRVESRDFAALWAASGRGPLTGVMPLPDNREFAGLATALTEGAERRGVPMQLLFRQGSRLRLQFLNSERVDFVVASAAVAHSGELPTAALSLGPYTYYGKDSVVVITPSGAERGNPKRVPVDRNSGDHYQLTQREFPDAELVEAPYPFIPELVVSGKFDAAVWHQTASSPLLVANGISIHPLTGPRASTSEALDRAALIWRSADAAVGGFISEYFEPSMLKRIQREVMDGVRIPQF